MHKTVGKSNFQAAIFVYKSDGTEKTVWPVVEAIDVSHGGICGQLHDDKAEFLKSLSDWNSQIDPSNAFLCIYAHMGALGINCVRGKASTRVTWAELANALIRPVELLWLVGCKSEQCMTKWNPLSSPVGHLLLATSESKLFKNLVRCFAAEIDIKHIRYYDEMPSCLAAEEPKLAECTAYFRPTAKGFKKAFR